MSRFTVTLPSNSSMDYFDSNTVANVSTKLAHSIERNGKWEVGLSTISVPAEVENVIYLYRHATTDPYNFFLYSKIVWYKLIEEITIQSLRINDLIEKYNIYTAQSTDAYTFLSRW